MRKVGFFPGLKEPFLTRPLIFSSEIRSGQQPASVATLIVTQMPASDFANYQFPFVLTRVAFQVGPDSAVAGQDLRHLLVNVRDGVTDESVFGSAARIPVYLLTPDGTAAVTGAQSARSFRIVGPGSDDEYDDSGSGYIVPPNGTFKVEVENRDTNAMTIAADLIGYQIMRKWEELEW